MSSKDVQGWFYPYWSTFKFIQKIIWWISKKKKILIVYDFLQDIGLFKTLLKHMRSQNHPNIEYMETDWHTLDWNRRIEIKHSKGYKIVDLRGQSLHSMSYSRLVETMSEIINSPGTDGTIPDVIVGPGQTSPTETYTGTTGDSHGGGYGISDPIQFLMDNKTGVYP